MRRSLTLRDWKLVGAMKQVQSGGCRCSAVRYELSQPPIAVYVCHCRDCQRFSGSPFSFGAFVDAAAFRLTGVEPTSSQHVSDGGVTKTRWLCSNCSTWVFSGTTTSDEVGGSYRVLRAGTFDDTSWLRPTISFWTRSALPWVTLPEGVKCFETQPDNLQAELLRGQGDQSRK